MDLTVAAVPCYFASMGAEAWWFARTRDERDPVAGDYERDDTLASLAMGTASLFVPLVTRPVVQDLAVGKGRFARAALAVGATAAAATAVADALRRGEDMRSQGIAPGELPDETSDSPPEPTGGTPSQPEPATNRRSRRDRVRRVAEKLAGPSAVTAIAATGAVVAGTWARNTIAKKMFARRILPDWGTGPLAAIAAVAGWDFIYYWNHRMQHEVRYMWAIHVVHHSSQHYNLSTALRQPVADALGTFVPYGVMSWLGIRPSLIEQARGINLIYQFWIHTEAIRSIGPLEKVLNTPSHHRVHHGANRQYLDRNHGSILIIWDKLFGTFEPEDEEVRYGLTRNIESHNPIVIASHEYLDIAADVAASDNWTDRLSYVARGPGWAYARRDELAARDDGSVADPDDLAAAGVA